ncbi:MAG: hypothetical protein K0B02_04215 [DPANN group archaeon]|nr:hypothetical protein [DPANN group archaeon]
MDITYSIENIENFNKIIINVMDFGRPIDASVSVSLKTFEGNEYIFIPSYVSVGTNPKKTAYPEEYINFVNVTDIGEFTLFFHSKEKIKTMQVFVQYRDVLLDKVFEL